MKNIVFLAMQVVTILCAYAQSNVVYYGATSNALDVVFVDTNLSVKVKSAITADLRICLQEWGKTAELRLRDKGDSVGYLDIGTRSPHYPEDIDFPRNVVSNGTAGVALQITKELSDAYTNAFAFAAVNAEAVKTAYTFVSLITSNGFAETLTPVNITQYIVMKQYKPADYVTNFQDLKQGFVELKYLQPSILGFHEKKTGLFGKSLWTVIPFATLPEDPGDRYEWMGVPAVWHKGKWKLYVDLDE